MTTAQALLLCFWRVFMDLAISTLLLFGLYCISNLICYAATGHNARRYYKRVFKIFEGDSL